MADKHLWVAVLLISLPAGTAASGKGADTKLRMEMAFDALDDQYDECESEMEKLVEEKIPDDLKKVWDKEAKETNIGDTELSKNHKTAILVYKTMKKEFNKATVMGGMDYNTFPYKKLHFYLTDAVKTLLKKTGKSECHNVHLVSEQEIVADTAAVIRFGQFVTTDKTAPKSPGKTHFIIKTCSGVAFDTLGKGLILIPPYEVFSVTAVKGQDIHLDHLDDMSYHNCLGAPTSIPEEQETISSIIMKANEEANFFDSDFIEESTEEKLHKRQPQPALQPLPLPWPPNQPNQANEIQVPFTIDFRQAFGNLYTRWRKSKKVKRALASFFPRTCIRFVPYNRNHQSYVQITRLQDDNRCVTRTRRNQQGAIVWPIVINLGVKRCFTHGVIQHELNHALGFKHEHSRHDRDRFIRVVLPPVPQGQPRPARYRQYDRNNYDTRGILYDYISIMHYGRSRIITPLRQLPQGQDLGNRLEMSERDIERINTFYGCGPPRRDRRRQTIPSFPPV